jgi:hypothetical protein
MMKPLRVEFDMTRENLMTAADVLADHDAGVRMVRRRAQCILAGLIAALVTLQAAQVRIDCTRLTRPDGAWAGRFQRSAGGLASGRVRRPTNSPCSGPTTTR